MTKREAEYQLTKDSMSEGGVKTLNAMNSQSSQKATAAQLAQRKIREAKGSLSRRRPGGHSPAPTSQNSSVFSGIQGFGVNGFGGAQPQQSSQPSFLAGPGGTEFNFATSAGTNPFNSATPSNPFGPQASAKTFSQPASASGPQESVFASLSNSQPAPNPFGGISSFSFGQPQSQTASIFSKPPSTSNAFTFGGASNFGSPASTFGGSSQKLAAGDSDETMDISGNSPRKNQTGSSTATQPGQTYTGGMFGASNTFSSQPANNSTPADQTSESSHPFSQFLQTNQNGVDQSSKSASSSSFQPIGSMGNGSPAPQSTQSVLPTFNFFPSSTKARKDEPEKSTVSSASSLFKSFGPGKGNHNDSAYVANSGMNFSFGAVPGATLSEARQPSILSGNDGDTNSEPKSASTLFQSTPSANASLFNPLQPSKSTEAKKPGSPAVFNIFHPKPSTEAKETQAGAKVNPFKASAAASIEMPIDPTPQSSFANPFLQASKPFGTPKIPERAQESKVTKPQFSMFNPSDTKEPNGMTVTDASFQKLETRRAEDSTEQSIQSSTTNPFTQASRLSAGDSRNIFQTSKSNEEQSMSDSVPSTKLSFGGNVQDHACSIPQSLQGQGETLPPGQSSAVSSVTSVNGNLASARTPDTSRNVCGPQTAQRSSTLDSREPFRTPSHTSDLFSKSLQNSSSQKASTASAQAQAKSSAGLNTSSALVLASDAGGNATVSALSAVESESVNPKVKSHGPSTIPGNLDSESYVDYDKVYRLRSLNARFKEQIALLNPATDDFEVYVRFYASQRAAIGFPIGGLYHRVKAGDKRKPESQHHGEAPSHVKRAKVANAEPNFSTSTSQPATLSSIDMNRSPLGIAPAESSAVTTGQSTTFDNPNMVNDTTSSSRQLTVATQRSTPESTTFKSVFAAPQMNAATSQALSPFGYASSPLTSKKQITPQDGPNGLLSAAATPEALFKPIPAIASALKVPNFGSPNGANFMAAFAAEAKKNAAKMEAENKAKRKAEDFDSEEDDEAEYDRRVAEEDRAKRAKIENNAKSSSGFTPVLSLASSAVSASPAPEQDMSTTKEASAEASETSSEHENPGSEGDYDEDPNGPEDPNDPEYRGILDEESEPDENADGVEQADQEEPQSDEDDDIQTAMAKSYSRGKQPDAPASESRSLFDRISKPDDSIDDERSSVDSTAPRSQLKNDSTVPAPPGTGLFGSRPSTPSFDTQPLRSSILSNSSASTPPVDNTWKPGSAIKFGSTTAPAFSFTPATPLGKSNEMTSKNPFSTFAGAGTLASITSNDINNNGSSQATSNIFGSGSNQAGAGFVAQVAESPNKLFGEDPKKTTVNQSSAGKVGFAFGAPEKPGASPLLAPSNISSALTSRNTSPGLTDLESATESGPDDQASEAQTDFMSSRPGEENEEVVFQVRTKVLEPMTANDLAAAGSKESAGYKTRGLGPLRILKSSETGRTRIVMRSDPAANVIINSPLLPNNSYDVQTSGKDGASVKLGIYQNGNVKGWVLKIKSMQTARDLVDHLKKNEPKPVCETA